MKTKFLLPNSFKKIGWIFVLAAILLWLYSHLILDNEMRLLETDVFAIIGSEDFSETRYFSILHTNLTNTLIGTFFIVGGLLVVFSKETSEDEFISQLRLEAFQWSVLINYILLLLSFLFVYGIDFLTIMLYNIFTTLILLIFRFHFLLWKFQHLEYEK